VPVDLFVAAGHQVGAERGPGVGHAVVGGEFADPAERGGEVGFVVADPAGAAVADHLGHRAR
jgi:hypothetical protein